MGGGCGATRWARGGHSTPRRRGGGGVGGGVAAGRESGSDGRASAGEAARAISKSMRDQRWEPAHADGVGARGALGGGRGAPAAAGGSRWGVGVGSRGARVIVFLLYMGAFASPMPVL